MRGIRIIRLQSICGGGRNLRNVPREPALPDRVARWGWLSIALASLLILVLAPTLYAFAEAKPKPARGVQAGQAADAVVRCANLIYAGSKSSKCFSDKFLATTRVETNIETQANFDPVKLSKDELFEYPFSVMTGEGLFNLLEEERLNLRAYLERGGFLLASAGCSSKEWDQSFRKEIKKVFPELELVQIPMEHKIFKTVFDVTSVRLKKSQGTASLEGLEIDGRIVLIYSPEGLNDTGNAGGGCCCCGGNEVRNSQEINVNVLTYSLTH